MKGQEALLKGFIIKLFPRPAPQDKKRASMPKPVVFHDLIFLPSVYLRAFIIACSSMRPPQQIFKVEQHNQNKLFASWAHL